MGEPTQPRERTAQAYLEARVRDLGRYTLSLRCFPGCARSGHIDLRDRVRTHGALQLVNFIRKLKCLGCRRPPERVRIYLVEEDTITERCELM